MIRFAATLLALAFACLPVAAATLLPPGKVTFTDANGKPLAGGTVAFYLLALKGNRPTTHGDVARFFADPGALVAEIHEPLDNDHGRLERRRASVCHDVTWMISDRRYPDEPHMPHLAMIGLVETQVERAGRTERERRYYLSSARLDAKAFAAAVRAHWQIENRLHWVLDIVFHDDLVRLRPGTGPQNMAVARHRAMNLVRAPHARHNLNPDYLQALIRHTHPTPSKN